MIFSKISGMTIMASLFISTVALANSVMFEQSVYAVDNCDATSTCTNVDLGSANSQTNDCTDFSTCLNTATGTLNTQSNDCNNINSPGCSNSVNSFLAETNDNTQSNDCKFGGNFNCSNEIVDGSGNIQKSKCESAAEASCFNSASFAERNDRNTQNTECVSVVVCGNQAIGSDNSQNVECSESGFACLNFASGNDNNQNVECKDNEVIICSNSVSLNGDRNSMDLHCKNNAGECSGFVFEGSDNTHFMNCDSVGTTGCFNRVLGNNNIQNMNCKFVGDQGCINNLINFQTFGFSNDNTQDMDCMFVSTGCTNNAIGDGNNQDLRCVRSSVCTNESNSPTGANTQKTLCINSGTCQNSGTNTEVISVKSDNCESDDAAGSKTICVNNRIITRPTS